MSDDLDFDTDMVVDFMATLSQYGRDAEMYGHPNFVNVKLGFYVSYELTKLRAEAAKNAAEESKKPKDDKPDPFAKKPTTEPPKRTEAKTAAKVKMEIPGSKATFQLPMKYVIHYSDAILDISLVGKLKYEYDEDGYREKAKNAKDKFHHLTATRVLGDAVNDTPAELKRCAFPYYKDLGGMSESARKAYGKKLDDITYVPADDAPDAQVLAERETADQPDYFTNNGFRFKKFLASTCTYTASGEYFGKWTSDALKKPYRAFVGPNLKPDYFLKATGEYELEQGYYYGLLTSPAIQRLYRLTPNKDKKPDDKNKKHKEHRDPGLYTLDLIISLDDGQLIPPGGDSEWEDVPKPDLIIFKAVHGLKKGGGRMVKAPAFRYHKVDKGAYERLGDPQREVEGSLGKDAAKKLRAHSDFDWFIELAKLRFTEDLYQLDITKALERGREDGINEMTFLADMRKEKAEEFGRTLYDWAGNNEIRVKSLEPMRKLIENPNVLLIPQGTMISDNVKFVGLDADYAWARDLKHDVTIKMPHEALIAELAERYKYNLLYKNSEGVIYFSMIVVWGGLAVMGLTLIPGIFSMQTLYRTIMNRLRSAAANKIIKEVLIYEIPAMAAVVAEFIAMLFVAADVKKREAKLWAAFARGFFKGYAENTLKKLFFNIKDDIAHAVLKEYYLYQRIKKLHHTVKKLAEKYEELSKKLDPKHVDKLILQFEQAASHAIGAVLMLFHTLSFLEHHDAQDVIVGLTSGMNDPLEDLKKSEWYIEAKEAIRQTVDSAGKWMSGTGKKVFDKVDGALDWIESNEKLFEAAALIYTANHLVKGIKQLKASEKPKTSPAKIAVVVVGVVGGVVVLDQITDGKSTEVLERIGSALTTGLPGKNEGEATTRGEIYGTALGALFFDHGLIGGSSGLGRLAKTDKIAKRVRKGAKVGIIMPILELLLQRYIAFYRRALGYDGKEGDVQDLLKDLSRWRTDRPELQKFEAFRATETGTNINEIVSSVLNIERFLDSEVRDRWASKWGPRIEAYEADIAAFQKDAQVSGLEDLIKDHAPVIGHAMLMHFRVVVRKIRQAFEEMAHEIDGVVTEEGSKLSLLQFIEMLGFDLGDLDAVVAEFDEDAKEKLKEYVKS